MISGPSGCSGPGVPGDEGAGGRQGGRAYPPYLAIPSVLATAGHARGRGDEWLRQARTRASAAPVGSGGF